MVSKTKIAFIAAIAAIGIATPALAQDPIIPRSPSDFITSATPSSQVVVHDRALYNSAAVPSNNVTDNWAYDAQHSVTNQVAH
jgi:hypothetical protein